MRAALIAGALALVALVHTWPLILHVDSALPGQTLGDNVSFVWNLWWMRQAIASPAAGFWYSPLLMAPLGASLALHTHTALAAALGATVLGTLSVVAAQNVLLFVSVMLNGVSAYVLARTAGASAGGAAIGGVLFELSPTITARLMGHFNLVAVWPLLFACAAFVSWWRRPTPGRAVLAGVVAGAVPYSDYYYTVYFAVFAATWILLATLRIDVAAGRRHSRVWVVLLVTTAAAAAIGLAIGLAGVDHVAVGSVRVALRTPTNALTLAWVLLAATLLARWRVSVSAHAMGQPLPPRRQLALAVVIAALIVLPLGIAVARVIASGDYVTQSSSLRSGPRGADAATLVLGPPFSGTVGSRVRAAYAAFTLDVMESSAGSAWCRSSFFSARCGGCGATLTPGSGSQSRSCSAYGHSARICSSPASTPGWCCPKRSCTRCRS